MARADPDVSIRRTANMHGGEARARSPDREHDYEALGRANAESRASWDQRAGYQPDIANQVRDDHGRFASER